PQQAGQGIFDDKNRGLRQGRLAPLLRGRCCLLALPISVISIPAGMSIARALSMPIVLPMPVAAAMPVASQQGPQIHVLGDGGSSALPVAVLMARGEQDRAQVHAQRVLEEGAAAINGCAEGLLVLIEFLSQPGVLLANAWEEEGYPAVTLCLIPLDDPGRR